MEAVQEQTTTEIVQTAIPLTAETLYDLTFYVSGKGFEPNKSAQAFDKMNAIFCPSDAEEEAHLHLLSEISQMSEPFLSRIKEHKDNPQANKLMTIRKKPEQQLYAEAVDKLEELVRRVLKTIVMIMFVHRNLKNTFNRYATDVSENVFMLNALKFAFVRISECLPFTILPEGQTDKNKWYDNYAYPGSLHSLSVVRVDAATEALASNLTIRDVRRVFVSGCYLREMIDAMFTAAMELSHFNPPNNKDRFFKITNEIVELHKAYFIPLIREELLKDAQRKKQQQQEQEQQ